MIELVSLPFRQKTIVNKWVPKVKQKLDRSINKYKAQLVRKGYNEINGIDFEVTFSPMVRIVCICLLTTFYSGPFEFIVILIRFQDYLPK